MEQTLGKRIVAHRKRLGLTQDQLADRLGVTAQAVSKWENDQSCPDITMLPKLAQIFGISTDELLGHETAHKAEILPEEEDDEDENEGIHFQKGNWEFRWDSGRRSALSFAVLVLMVGALTFCARLFHWDADFWEILWPSVLIVFGLSGLLPGFSFFRLGCTLFGAYFLIDNLDIFEMNIAGELIFPAVIIIFGLSLLVDALRKPKRPKFRVSHKGKGTSGKTKSDYSVENDRFNCDLCFGETDRYVEVHRLAGGEASVSFGEMTLDLTGCEEVTESCSIDASCSFGSLIIKVPSRFRVEPDCGTAFASLEIKGHPDASPQGVIHLDGNVSFGAIEVRYV